MSPYIWANGGEDCWKSTRLSDLLKREFREQLQTEMSITIWRHTAIALSKKYCKGGGFKRDYSLYGSETASDRQAGHTSWTAGTIYARGLEEARGQVENYRKAYRAVSVEWHQLLGFRGYINRKRKALETIESSKIYASLTSTPSHIPRR